MIDHIYLPVSDLKRSSEFYKKVLGPLGIDMPYRSVNLAIADIRLTAGSPGGAA